MCEEQKKIEETMEVVVWFWMVFAFGMVGAVQNQGRKIRFRNKDSTY